MYRVTWSSDIEATSARDAAEQALADILREPTGARVFEAFDTDPAVRRVVHVVDLSTHPEDEDLSTDLWDDNVTCDDCDTTSESGWGDQPTCLVCTPREYICAEHQRTHDGSGCPLPH